MKRRVPYLIYDITAFNLAEVEKVTLSHEPVAMAMLPRPENGLRHGGRLLKGIGMFMGANFEDWFDDISPLKLSRFYVVKRINRAQYETYLEMELFPCLTDHRQDHT